MLDRLRKEAMDLPLYKWMVVEMDCLESMTSLEQVCQLEQVFNDFCQHYRREMRLQYFGEINGRLFARDEDAIVKRKREILVATNSRAKLYYETSLVLRESEKVNGYALYDIDTAEILDFCTIEKLARNECLALDSDNNANDFAEWLDNELCNQWSKMDADGNDFAGFWEFPEGSYEHENAWTLTRKANIAALVSLPYPRSLVKWTLKVGCANLRECVRYSNFLCHYIEANAIRLGLWETLEEKCRYRCLCDAALRVKMHNL